MIVRKKPRSTWSVERIELLKKMWADGSTGLVIAVTLGGFEHCKDHGRANVLKMARKLELESRKSGATSGASCRGSGTPSIKGNVVQDLFAKEPEMSPAEELVIPLKERKTLETLAETSCRWPIGDVRHKDFHFCGRTKMQSLSYCEFHARRAYVPLPPRGQRVRVPMVIPPLALR